MKEGGGEDLERMFGLEGTVGVSSRGAGGARGGGRWGGGVAAGSRRVLRLNLVAGLLVPTKVFAARWIERKQKGTVVNIASMASYVPLSGVWGYDAAKAGVLN